jgi:predicted amidohydrolase
MTFRVHGLVAAVALIFSLSLSASELPDASDWSAGNLLTNGDFTHCEPGRLPHGWKTMCPNPAIAPEFRSEMDSQGRCCLTAKGNGREECFGYVSHRVHLTGGKSYRMRVQLHEDGLDDLNRNLIQGVFGEFNNGIFNYRKDGDDIVGENSFTGPTNSQNAEVRLYFRFSPNGKVWWERVSLQECAPMPPRLVKIACSWGRGNLDWWSHWLDAAGKEKVDVALLPEMFNGKSPKQSESSNGPSATLLSEKARQWHMYVTGSYYEKRDGLVYNTAHLFDREGKPVGSYSKMELYEPEEDEGVTPGTDLPVFDTDFGKLGIMICYDSWFPEVARLLAYKGAELVLLPNAGYFTDLMPARAADNGVYLAASSLNDPAGIWDASGARAGDKSPDSTRQSPTAISDYQMDTEHRMIIATVDLARHFSPAWHGGPMHSAPGGRRVRQSLIRPLEADVAREAAQWWTNSNQ